MNKQKITIIVLSCLIAVGLVVSVTMAVKDHQSLNKKSESEQTSKIKIEKDANGKEIEVADFTKATGEFEIGNEKAKKIDSTKAKMVEDTVRNLISQKKWKEASDEIAPLISKYNMDTEEGKVLQNIYYDTALIQNLPGVEKEYYPQVLSGIKDEKDLLVAVLGLSEERRRNIILNEDSLNPIFEGDVQIEDMSKYDGNMITDINKTYEDVSQVKKIDFKVNNIPLEGYILQFGDGSIKLYKILAKEGTKHDFQTIKYWRNLDKQIEENLKK